MDYPETLLTFFHLKCNRSRLLLTYQLVHLFLNSIHDSQLEKTKVRRVSFKMIIFGFSFTIFLNYRWFLPQNTHLLEGWIISFWFRKFLGRVFRTVERLSLLLFLVVPFGLIHKKRLFVYLITACSLVEYDFLFSSLLITYITFVKTNLHLSLIGFMENTFWHFLQLA